VGSKLTVSDTKTKNSKRRLLLPSEAVEVLRLHRVAQLERHTKLEILAAQDWLFTTDAGTVFRPDNLMRTYKALCLEAGVRPIRLHDLRYTYVRLAGRAKVPITVVSKQAGHARPSFTADVYRHIYADEMQQAALNLSELLSETPRIQN
jgi:integrase